MSKHPLCLNTAQFNTTTMLATTHGQHNGPNTEMVQCAVEPAEIQTTTSITPTTDLERCTRSLVTTSAVAPTLLSSTASFEAAEWHTSPSNPLNWSQSRKWLTTILLSALTFNTLMTSTMVIPALPQITHDLHIPLETRTQMILSIFPLAYICGFFLWAPLSELYGRLPILHLAGVWFVTWNVLGGFARAETVILTSRLFSGAGAASALAISPGVVGDIWPAEQRGRSLAILSAVSLLGPSIGPILGGLIASQARNTWRWAFWSTSVLQAVLQLLAGVVLEESHAPTIMRRETSIGVSARRAKCRTSNSQRIARTLQTALRRPFRLFLTQPVLICLTLYTGTAFGMLYLVLSTVSDAFGQTYKQPLSISSLNFLSFGVGMTVGAQLGALHMDRMYKKKTQDDLQEDIHSGEVSNIKNESATETRLAPFVPAVLITATGALIYGWTLHFQSHWITPNIGLVLFGAGNQAMTQCTNAYVIDNFSTVPDRESAFASHRGDNTAASIPLNVSASAMCTIWAAKSVGGFVYPLAAPNMLKALDWGWSGTVVAICTVVIGVPTAGLLVYKGSTWREKAKDKI